MHTNTQTISKSKQASKQAIKQNAFINTICRVHTSRHAHTHDVNTFKLCIKCMPMHVNWKCKQTEKKKKQENQYRQPISRQR